MRTRLRILALSLIGLMMLGGLSPVPQPAVAQGTPLYTYNGSTDPVTTYASSSGGLDLRGSGLTPNTTATSYSYYGTNGCTGDAPGRAFVQVDGSGQTSAGRVFSDPGGYNYQFEDEITGALSNCLEITVIPQPTLQVNGGSGPLVVPAGSSLALLGLGFYPSAGADVEIRVLEGTGCVGSLITNAFEVSNQSGQVVNTLNTDLSWGIAFSVYLRHEPLGITNCVNINVIPPPPTETPTSTATETPTNTPTEVPASPAILVDGSAGPVSTTYGATLNLAGANFPPDQVNTFPLNVFQGALCESSSPILHAEILSSNSSGEVTTSISIFNTYPSVISIQAISLGGSSNCVAVNITGGTATATEEPPSPAILVDGSAGPISPTYGATLNLTGANFPPDQVNTFPLNVFQGALCEQFLPVLHSELLSSNSSGEVTTSIAIPNTYPSVISIQVTSVASDSNCVAIYIIDGTETPTETPTEVPPTATNTATETPTEVPPTATNTATETPTEVPPTATNTATETPTEVPPTATNTATETPTNVPPTETFTPTEVVYNYVILVNGSAGPVTVSRGDTVTVTGSGFPPDQSGTILLTVSQFYECISPPVLVAHISSNSAGEISHDIYIEPGYYSELGVSVETQVNVSNCVDLDVVDPTETPTDVPPTATLTPTETATNVPPTETFTPTETATNVPPTATDEPPTSTVVPPTATDVPPTSTIVPPTATEVPATEAPTQTPTGSAAITIVTSTGDGIPDDTTVCIGEVCQNLDELAGASALNAFVSAAAPSGTTVIFTDLEVGTFPLTISTAGELILSSEITIEAGVVTSNAITYQLEPQGSPVAPTATSGVGAQPTQPPVVSLPSTGSGAGSASGITMLLVCGMLLLLSAVLVTRRKHT